MATETRPQRDAYGRFLKGNRGGPGNPHAKYVNELRKQLFSVQTPEAFYAQWTAMHEKACGGDVPACRLLWEYTFGKPVEYDFIERLERLEDVSGAEPIEPPKSR